MFSSNPAKSFYLFFVFALLFSACGWRQKPAETSNTNSTAFGAQEIPGELPFQTAEPEIFQAEIVTTIFSGDEKTERRSFVARNGANRLAKFAVGERTETARLQTADGKTFLLGAAGKVYAEASAGQTLAAVESETLQDHLTSDWLNAKTNATFENLGAENGLTKFLVRLGGADANEILIFYDEAAKIVMKQEFYGGSGGERTIFYSVEMKNLRAETDANLFELPKDFRKVSLKEFEQFARQED